MDRTTLMIATLFVAVFASLAAAQPRGYVEVWSLKTLPSKKLGCYQLNSGLYDRAKLIELKKIPSCAEHLPVFEDDNAKDQIYAYYAVSGDCHMRVDARLFRNDLDKKYVLIINNTYGGCRAVGRRSGWIEFDPMPPDHKFEIKVVSVDRQPANAPSAEFKFPEPPSTKKQRTVAIREVDLGECLPLTGQSQWILANREAIDRALSNEKSECREIVERLGLDLSKEALVGYSFQSGYCHRPVGLEFSAIHEMSSDPREDLLMIKATFRDVGDAYCKVWITFPVWLIVEKPAGNFRYEFFAERKK